MTYYEVPRTRNRNNRGPHIAFITMLSLHEDASKDERT